MILLHGFNDFHYNNELIDKLNSRGFNVFALTLRHYGLNILDDSRIFYPENSTFKTYFTELDETINYIKHTVLNAELYITAHSTGALIVSYYFFSKRDRQSEFKKCVLNGPFFDLQDTWLMETLQKKFIRYGNFIIRIFKNIRISIRKPVEPVKNSDGTYWVSGSLKNSDQYDALIKSGLDFNSTEFAPKRPNILIVSPLYVAFSNASVKAQSVIQTSKLHYYSISEKLTVKTLVLWASNDSILTPSEIKKYSISAFENLTLFDHEGNHNVFSSIKENREYFYKQYFNFIIDDNDDNEEKELTTIGSTLSGKSICSGLC